MTPRRAAPAPAPPPAGAPRRRVIPFDQAFVFALKGRPGNVVRSTVTVSVEAAFVARAMGHGFRPKVETLPEGLRGLLSALVRAPQGVEPERQADLEAALRQGIRLSPTVASVAFGMLLERTLDESLLELVAPTTEAFQFMYALFDDATGREFQSAPILSTAGLGAADGVRPFRHFATPIVFEPRSTIRMEITEASPFAGELQVVLHGCKALGAPGSPTEARPSAGRRPGRPGALR